MSKMLPIGPVTRRRQESNDAQNKQSSCTTASLLRQKGYCLGMIIGEGSYCKVKTAVKFFSDGHCVKMACKMISKTEASNDFVTKFLPREISILRGLHHPNIIKVFDVFESLEHVYIFTNICEKGDLLEYIKRKGALLQDKARRYFRQVTSAVCYLHNLDVAHRDLKCENIFIMYNENLVIGDFGFSRSCWDLRTHKRILSQTFCGSAAYAAPEILQGIPYNPKMYDVWSLGCVLYIMLTGCMPFDDSSVKKMLKCQLMQMFELRRFNLRASSEELLYQMLEPDITKRATIYQIADCRWLKEHYYQSFYPYPPVKYIAQR